MRNKDLFNNFKFDIFELDITHEKAKLLALYASSLSSVKQRRVFLISSLMRKIARFMHLSERDFFITGIFYPFHLQNHLIPPLLFKKFIDQKLPLSSEFIRELLAALKIYTNRNNGLNEDEVSLLIPKLHHSIQNLITDLFNTGVLTQRIENKGKNIIRHNALYNYAWKYGASEHRIPKECGRHIAIATALEPLSDKFACTTRFANANRYLQLEYFIASAINISEAFEELANRIITNQNVQPKIIYDIALRAQHESLRNRKGGKVVQGIIEMFIPIVTSQFVFDPLKKLTVEEILKKAGSILQFTTRQDVEYLIKMKRFALDSTFQFNIKVPKFPVTNVFSYYQKSIPQFNSNAHPSMFAHNREFVTGFPTVLSAYNAIKKSTNYHFTERCAEAFRKIRMENKGVGRGFLADCICIAIYLILFHNPQEKIVT